MTYTYLSAQYSNADNTAINAETIEVGCVLISEMDTPEEWQAVFESGITVATYVTPETVSETLLLNEIPYIGTSTTLKKKKWEIVMTDSGPAVREKV